MATQARQPSREMPEAMQAQPRMTEAQGHNPVAEGDIDFSGDKIITNLLTCYWHSV